MLQKLYAAGQIGLVPLPREFVAQKRPGLLKDCHADICNNENAKINM